MTDKQLEEMARATALALESRLMFDRKEWEMIILELAKQIQTETALNCAGIAESMQDEVNEKEGEICIAYNFFSQAIKTRYGLEG